MTIGSIVQLQLKFCTKPNITSNSFFRRPALPIKCLATQDHMYDVSALEMCISLLKLKIIHASWGKIGMVEHTTLFYGTQSKIEIIISLTSQIPRSYITSVLPLRCGTMVVPNPKLMLVYNTNKFFWGNLCLTPPLFPTQYQYRQQRQSQTDRSVHIHDVLKIRM